MEKVRSNDGTSIAYSKTGRGPAIILVDGAFCYSTYGPGTKLAPLLAEHFTVYAYDRRGRGHSRDAGSYSLNKEIEDLAAMVKATGETPFIVGSSSGAALVMEAMIKGVKAKKIALFEPPYVAGSGGAVPPKQSRQILSELISRDQRQEAVNYFMSKIMGVPGIIIFFLKIFGRSMWKKNLEVAHTLVYDAEVMKDFSVPKDAHHITAPALVIGGEKSPPDLRYAVEATAKCIPNSRIKWLKGQRHNASMEVLAPVLIDFFR